MNLLDYFFSSFRIYRRLTRDRWLGEWTVGACCGLRWRRWSDELDAVKEEYGVLPYDEEEDWRRK